MISIELTVHQKDWLLEEVLTSIFTNSSELVTQVVVVLDGCTDKSEQIAKGFPVVIAYTPDVFETKANNVGLQLCTEPYCMIIQDDMIIQEKDFDKRMLKPFQDKEVFAVSARHALNDIIVNGEISYSDMAGSEYGTPRNIFAIRDVVNRGPLLLDNNKLQALDYLDEEFSPQSYDDHDICYRAYKQFGWLSGVYWIDYRSDSSWGSARGKNAGIITSAHQVNSRKIMERYPELLNGSKHNEERSIE